jgi:hypothetical protein
VGMREAGTKPHGECETLRKALLEYCGQDTEAVLAYMLHRQCPLGSVFWLLTDLP